MFSGCLADVKKVNRMFKNSPSDVTKHSVKWNRSIRVWENHKRVWENHKCVWENHKCGTDRVVFGEIINVFGKITNWESIDSCLGKS